MKWHKEPYMLFASKVSVCNLHPFTMAFRHLRKTHLLKASALKLAKDCSDSMLKALTRSYVSALVSLHRGNPWNGLHLLGSPGGVWRRETSCGFEAKLSMFIYVYPILQFHPSSPVFGHYVWLGQSILNSFATQRTASRFKPQIGCRCLMICT